MANYAQHLVNTPQNVRADPRQAENSAGGYTFQIDHWKRLDRFLVLGCEGGTYYAREPKLTVDNATCIRQCLSDDPARAVARIAEISEAGRAPKNDPAVFALALAASDSSPVARKAALDALPCVCRIGTHLFQFAEAINQLRGWGRGLRRAVARWYETKSQRDLCYQVVKYQQRGGWSHRDMLRLAHPDPDAEHAPVYRYVVGGSADEQRQLKRGERLVTYPAAGTLPAYLGAFEELKRAGQRRALELIREHQFTHEMLPSEMKRDPAIWEALLEHMPMTAMIRNLATMTTRGLLVPLGKSTRLVCDRLGDETRIRKARVHPIAVLSALKVYSQGRGERGSLTWRPVQQIVDALDSAFYLAFGNVEPSGKRTLLALDVSGSMTWGSIAGVPGLNPRLASAAMAMVIARSEPQWHCLGFSHTMRDVPISPRMRLDAVVRTIERIPMGGTDCALPMLHAAGNALEVDTFQVFTDNETWFGQVHPHQALSAYRVKMGIPARLAVIGCTGTDFTIADPSDPGMLDLVGFDTATPNILAAFAKGEI